MKKSIYIFFLGAVALLSSCNENDKNYGRFDADPTGGWVQFSEDCAGIVYGATSEITIPVELYVPVNSDGTDVSYTLSDVVGNSTAIVPERSGSITITADDQENGGITGRRMVKNIVLNVTDAGLAETVEFDVTLTTTSKSQVTIGLPDNSKPVVKRVVVRAFGSPAYQYAGTSVQYLPGTPPTPAFVGPEYTQTLNTVPGTPLQFTTTSAWGPTFVQALSGQNVNRPYPATITITDVVYKDGAGNKVSGTYVVNVAGINDPASPNRYPGGKGTYNACTNTFDIMLNQGVFNSPFTVRTIYSPIPAE
ncbi:lipoprotein [Flavobacterium pallidum]|uniref:Uncharacterized protein n=1 Tax=Flavobacterium pallidum TaxID=2172098 RepID=A0A2S1SDR6_9FLAO|nr:lipoprotein [Flavobacterium pallidum]AWI24529.1 hypothetical protein HYN49_00710 [Flavobacterium pallidum]